VNWFRLFYSQLLEFLFKKVRLEMINVSTGGDFIITALVVR